MYFRHSDFLRNKFLEKYVGAVGDRECNPAYALFAVTDRSYKAQGFY
jgi:hypothetical protein